MGQKVQWLFKTEDLTILKQESRKGGREPCVNLKIEKSSCWWSNESVGFISIPNTTTLQSLQFHSLLRDRWTSSIQLTSKDPN